VRPFGFLLNKGYGAVAPRIPTGWRVRVNESFRRRLNDGIERLIDEACMANNLSVAVDLLTLLEKWYTRRAASYGRERRTDDAPLQRARRNVERLSTLRGFPVAGFGANSNGARQCINDGETASSVPDPSQVIINRLKAEIENANGKYQAALARTSELEAVLCLPIVRNTLLRTLDPDTHPNVTDAERRTLAAQFQKVSADLNNFGMR
jgi:hypothetical protein